VLAREKISNEDLEEYATGIASLQRLDTTVEEDNTAISPAMQLRHNKTAALLLMDEDIDGDLVDALREQRTTTPLQRKRRQILKELKRFTKKGNVRNVKQRGWSCQGYQYHAELTKKILQDEDKHRPFVELYRKLSLVLEDIAAEKSQQNKKEKFLPDRNEVWQL